MVTENSLVRYKNALNKASYDLDAFELRIILAAVAQLPVGKLASDFLLPVEASDLTAIGVDPKHAYSALRKACDTLFDRYISWKTRDEDGDEVVHKARWLQEVAYIDQKGRLMIQFSKRVAEHLDRLLPHITQFAYLELHSMSSSYAIRLYQMLAQFQNSPEKRFFIKVDDLKARLAIEGQYRSYTMFKRKVLDIAIKQINEAPYTAFKVRMSDKERGCKDSRKIVCLHFYILPKNKQPDIEGEAKEKDTTTGSLFAGSLTLERARLTPKQIAMYADFLAGNNEKYKAIAHRFYEDCRAKGLLNWQGKTQEECTASLREHLANPLFVVVIFDWLKKVGFGG